MSGVSLEGRSLVSLLDYEPDEIKRLLDLAQEIKANPGHYATALAGRTLFMYFEKPSLRTRTTFEAGMTQLGGHAIYYTAADGKFGVRESVEDVARNLGRWVDMVMLRTFSHQLIADMARMSGIPIVNGLSDLLHPCQALADYMTLREVKAETTGDLTGKKLVYVGDGNNVANSLINGGALLGVHVVIVTPAGCEPQAEIVAAGAKIAATNDGSVTVTNDLDAVAGADAVYTDVWASMGQEDEAAEKDRLFRPYQVNEALMQKAGGDAAFMHCLPAHRGDEVTDGVADAPQSVIFEQAENRLHAQKAVMLMLMGAA